MKSNIGIYKITNTITKMTYIGSSSELKSRKCQHFKLLRANNHSNQHLQNSFNKHGEENFNWEVLEYLPTNSLKEYLLKREQHYLDLYFGDSSYNILSKAGSPCGYKHTPEIKEKLREAGKNISEETRKKRSETLKGHTISEETRNKISKTLKESGFIPPSSKGRKLTEEAKLKLSELYKGRKWSKEAIEKRVKSRGSFKHSQETIDRIVNSRKNYKPSEETRLKISLGNKGKEISAETRLKISLGNKGRKPSQETIDKIINSRKNFRHSEETKLKMRMTRGKKIINIDTGITFNSMREASRYYNISGSHISSVCRGNRKTCGGYRWKYN